MISEAEATSWRLRECIRVRKLAATHRLVRMRRLQMLEEQNVWKREAGFDQIEIIAQMDVQRLRAGFDLKPLYSKQCNLRWPHTPEKKTLEMNVDVERLRMEIVLSQPAPPPQCDSSPRRMSAVGTGLDEIGVPRAETQSMEREKIFLFKPTVDGFLHICTSPEQETIILVVGDVGMDAETSTTKAQDAACEEFARPPKKGQQRRVTARGAEQTKQFDPGG